MSEVVLGVQPSVHAAYQAHKEEMGVSTTALYNKLDRVETGVAAALVRDSARLAAPVVHALRAAIRGGSLAIRAKSSTGIIWPRPNIASRNYVVPGRLPSPAKRS
jgi:hypothetical protein